VGKSLQHNYFVCQRYLNKKGSTTYIQTSYRCVLCKMPLCRKDCKNAAIGQRKSCLKEHKASKCPTLECYGKDRSYSKIPRELLVNLYRGTLANNAGRWSRVQQHSVESDEEEDEEEDERESEEEDEADEGESEEEDEANEEESVEEEDAVEEKSEDEEDAVEEESEDEEDADEEESEDEEDAQPLKINKRTPSPEAQPGKIIRRRHLPQQ
jgi:hypothetical protein